MSNINGILDKLYHVYLTENIYENQELLDVTLFVENLVEFKHYNSSMGLDVTYTDETGNISDDFDPYTLNRSEVPSNKRLYIYFILYDTLESYKTEFCKCIDLTWHRVIEYLASESISTCYRRDYLVSRLSTETRLNPDDINVVLVLVKWYAKMLGINRLVMDDVFTLEASIVDLSYIKKILPWKGLLDYMETNKEIYLKLLWAILLSLKKSVRFCIRILKAEKKEDIIEVLYHPFARLFACFSPVKFPILNWENTHMAVPHKKITQANCSIRPSYVTLKDEKKCPKE